MASISGFGTGCAAPTAGSVASRRARRLVAGAGLLASLMGASPVASLQVTVDSLRSTKGELRVCLTADPRNFPACVDDARAVTRTVPAAERGLRFEGLPPGHYAVAVIHDANGNAKLDTFMGIPKEGFGFSRNPAIGFGPPKFTAAAFDLGAEGSVQPVKMRYLL